MWPVRPMLCGVGGRVGVGGRLWAGMGGRVWAAAGDSSLRHSSTTPSTKDDVSGVVDVVVVGGGVIGCSCLYHLTKMGVTNTLLLEAHKLTSGTTWHTAGLFNRLTRTEVAFLLHDRTYQLLMTLKEETGVDPGWRNTGNLFIAWKDDQPEERRADFERFAQLGRVTGVESRMVDVNELKEIHPLLETSHLAVALYTPSGGTMDPSGLCEGLTRAAVRGGARVVEQCPVTAITTQETLLGGRRVTQVHTPRGTVTTNTVINAAGGWGNDISSMVGRQLPLQVFKHGYVVTGKVEGTEHLPVVRDYSASCYYKPQGDSLTVGGFESNPVPIDQLSPDSPFDLYEPNWDVFSGMLNGAMKTLPVMKSAGIKSTVYGPESFTPDHMPIVGEDAEVQGFYYCCGFNSHGMQMAGGCGEQMAHWVVEGRPTLDMFTYDVRRFEPRLVKDREWIRAKSHEGLAKNYSIVFPHDEPLAGRGKRLSPLHQELEAGGCVFQERHGWERPGWFHSQPAPVQSYDWYGAYDTQPASDQRYLHALQADCTFDIPLHQDTLAQECLSCRQRAAIFDLTSFGKFLLTGRDAEAAAAWVFSAPVTDRAPGAIVYTCMLNHRGGVEADLTVSVCEGGEGAACFPPFEGQGYYVITGGATAEYCRAHIVCEARRRGWHIDLTDLTEELAVMSLQGPHSRTILQCLTEHSLADVDFPLSSHKAITVAGHKCRALRLSFVGELGWELHIPRSSALDVYRAIKEAGKNMGLVDAGFRALDSLSCEKGYRHWHADLRPDDTPLEAGLAFTCKLKTNTDFLGRSALEQQQAKGITRRLITLTLQDSLRPLWGHEAIKRDGLTVGFIRRAEHAFTLGKVLAYGYVQQPGDGPITKHFLSTGEWQVEARLKLLSASIHLTHPFDPRNLRQKGIYKDQTL